MGNKLLSLLLFFCCALLFSFWSVQENTAPKVEIISPTKNGNLEWNTIVPYRITIVDQEDGNSEYDEINVNEVVLTVTYFADSSMAKNYAEEVASRSEKLSLMASSNCFTCHRAKDDLIGPSFEEIANRYDPTAKNRSYLAEKISKGSTGVWGEQIMPGQPELETDRVIQILEWIFQNAQDPNYTFYSGTEGAFKTRERPSNNPRKAVYVLHAQYADHGIKESHEKSKKRGHTIVLKTE